VDAGAPGGSEGKNLRGDWRKRQENVPNAGKKDRRKSNQSWVLEQKKASAKDKIRHREWGRQKLQRQTYINKAEIESIKEPEPVQGQEDE